MEKLRAMALAQVGLPARDDADGGPVVASVLGPRELDDHGRPALAEASRRATAGEHRGQRLWAPSYRAGPVEITANDDADCEDREGRVVSPFMRGARCYRIVAQVAY